MRHFVIRIMILMIMPGAADAAGFSCVGKLSSHEQLICNNKDLSSLDYRLNALYSVAIKVVKTKDAVRSAQRGWLRNVREKCTDIACLVAAYQQRISALMQTLQESANPLPMEIRGRVQHKATSSNYCKISGSEGTNDGDWFAIEATVHEQVISGRIDGIFDCGRKVWGDIEVTGHPVTNVALLKFQPGFRKEQKQPAEAIVVVADNKIIWRVLTEIEVESYVPIAEVIK
jgi:uncharacterized protein